MHENNSRINQCAIDPGFEFALSQYDTREILRMSLILAHFTEVYSTRGALSYVGWGIVKVGLCLR